MKHKNLITVVTDHQLTADTIAQALGATDKCDGYYAGNGYAVTWTGGELVEATFSPNESFVLSTTMNVKHIFAHNFKFAMRNYDELLGWEKSVQDSKQLATITALVKMSKVVVNAMAPDFNGETSFLSLYYLIGCPVEMRRAWLPVLRKQSIIKSVENGPRYPDKYESWLKREMYNLIAQESEAEATMPTPVFVENPVENIPDELANSGIDGVSELTPGSSTILPYTIYNHTNKPTLLNLPLLLVEAAVNLNWEHEKTVSTALILYRKRLISYPMVRQNYIPAEIWKQMIHNREVLRHNPKWGKHVKGIKVSSRHNFEGCENPYYGFGIITTGIHPVGLTRDEERLYNLIVKRVIDAFRPYKRRKSKKNHRKNGKIS